MLKQILFFVLAIAKVVASRKGLTLQELSKLLFPNVAVGADIVGFTVSISNHKVSKPRIDVVFGRIVLTSLPELKTP